MTHDALTTPNDETPPAEYRDWRGRIRPLAIVVFRRPSDGAILAAPGVDPVKQQRFYRPLGGEIEFGERSEDAARREIREEIGAEIDELSLLQVTENIFTYLGSEGHELIWSFEARFADPAYYDMPVVPCDESGANFEAHWVPLATFHQPDAPLLFPDGLLEALASAASKPDEP